MASKKANPVTMWGWTNHSARIVYVSFFKEDFRSNYFCGTRIRVVVAPAKKRRAGK